MRHSSARARGHIPPLRFDALTGLYDAVLPWLGLGAGFRFAVAAHLGVQPGERVLDVGAGTGTLAVLLKQLVPTATVVAADPDAGALAIARAKTTRAGCVVDLVEARAERLPMEDAGFDRVVSTLAWHHLPAETKRAAAAEVFRVLRPGGRFLLVDFGPLEGPRLAWINRALTRHPVEQVADNFAGRLPAMLADTGFVELATPYVHGGVVHFLRATRPRDDHGTSRPT